MPDPAGALTRARTAVALGLGNVAGVAAYRAFLLAGVHPAQRVVAEELPPGPHFSAAGSAALTAAPSAQRNPVRYFGWREVKGSPPDWFANPFTGARADGLDAPWWTLKDFDRRLGDIKVIWELSRFDWAVAFALQARAGDASAGDRLNAWVQDWRRANPAYLGPNWKCAQEASIRLMHLALAAKVLGEVTAPTTALQALVRTHLRRIAPTLSYARAQNNNHGTSEAAALFIGGSWLQRLGGDGTAWMNTGRALLEERARKLIARDGTFSQYSVVYQRLVLDTYSLAEIWRADLGLPSFSSGMRDALSAAASWLTALVDPATGDAPNFGHNDGANLLTLTDAGYRDFRPAVRLASALFRDVNEYPEDAVSAEHLSRLGVTSGRTASNARTSTRLDDGGLGVLRSGQARALLRYPRFKFRPAHADALHLDLTVAGANVLRDGGSGSYADSAHAVYFPSTEAHNTVQFDDRDQMPRVSRFLWGDWITTESVTPIEASGEAVAIRAAYVDGSGARHERSVSLTPRGLTVVDRVSGFRRKAVLRWRLMPGPWILRGQSASNGIHSVEIHTTSPVVRCELTTGLESRFYHQTSELPVLEIEIAAPGFFTTEVRWNT